MSLRVFPATLDEANAAVALWHRHHKPVRGHRFSIGARDDSGIVGAATVGRPVARKTEPFMVAEVTRVVTNGRRNACSFLYAACERICREMGFNRIQTFILASEAGQSLLAAGWRPIKSDGTRCECKKGCESCMTTGGDWNRPSRGGRRKDQPMVRKRRYGKLLAELEIQKRRKEIGERVTDKPYTQAERRRMRLRIIDLNTPWFWLTIFYYRQRYGKPWLEMALWSPHRWKKWWLHIWKWEARPKEEGAYAQSNLTVRP